MDEIKLAFKLERIANALDERGMDKAAHMVDKLLMQTFKHLQQIPHGPREDYTTDTEGLFVGALDDEPGKEKKNKKKKVKD